MSAAGELDIRVPIGALFTVLGLLVGGYGLFTAGNAPHYTRSLSVNINLWWGGVMLVFGMLMLLGAATARRKASAHPSAESPEGRATEAREHQLGLER
ncbi:MAG TPA: hypothetical protein VFS33_08780 [Gemmatimonadales bacterium]|nr:hypothetical protein [Gemmatimonadales bacterium]